MSNIFVKELKSYHEEDLKRLFKVKKDNEFYDIITKLLSFNLIKKISNHEYQFNKFVGIIIISELIINCYPKYLPDLTGENEEYIEKEFKLVLKTIRRFHKTTTLNYELEENKVIKSNLIALRLFFLEDYYENGIYSNFKNILEVNGNGEINWDKTINDKLAIIKDNQPYYIELNTKNKINDLKNFFHLLHKCIINDSSEKLEESKITDIFDLTPIELDDSDYDEFIEEYEEEELSEKILKEVNVEFNTHKQKLLKLMDLYVKEKTIFSENEDIDMYGTTTFSLIWEKVCSNVLDDKLYKTLKDLDECGDLPNGLNEYTNRNKERLIDLIDKPEWNINNHDNVQYDKEEEDEDGIKKNTLKPDIIVFDENTFIILDAKYYVYDYDKKNNHISKQPGIESITKQYLYELAYSDFLTDTGFIKTKNAFLFPSYKDKYIKNEGYVKLNFLSQLVKEKNEIFNNENHIQIIMIPASKFYKYYLNNKKVDDYSFLK